MPVNLEIKVKMDSHAKVKKLLSMIGAENKGILKQKDTYYKNKTGLLKLREQNGTYEFIKYNRDESGKKNRWSDYDILHIQGNKIYDFLGTVLKVETVVEKKREFWLYDNTRVHLDTVKGLGCFLELETLVIKGRKDAEKRFNEMVRILELDMKAQILASYRNLMLKKKPSKK
ncbi:MAG: CYTH domain-containing protein [Syntrophothermus sp.]